MSLINYLTKIQFDHGAISLIKDELKQLGVRRALIVSDRGLEAVGLVEKVSNVVGIENVAAFFLDTPQNPTEAAVMAGAKVFSENECDGIVALGGGSSIDLAKAVALMTSHEPPLEQYALILGGLSRISPSVKPLIAVPTTAGTGSEVGRGALITLSDKRKLGFIAPAMIPRVAICDPDLTLGLPAGLTAATGMDALTHCVETYLSPTVNPIADAIAIDGVKRAFHWLPRAVENGSDKEARWNMMMASLQGGLTFQKGLGAVHSMSHPLGGIADPVLHHGTLNAVILPAVLEFNRDHVGEKYAELGSVMGLSAGHTVVDAIRDINARIGMPAGLASMGVSSDILPKMAEMAVLDHSTASNPRPTSQEDFSDLFNAAM